MAHELYVNEKKKKNQLQLLLIFTPPPIAPFATSSLSYQLFCLATFCYVPQCCAFAYFFFAPPCITFFYSVPLLPGRFVLFTSLAFFTDYFSFFIFTQFIQLHHCVYVLDILLHFRSACFRSLSFIPSLPFHKSFFLHLRTFFSILANTSIPLLSLS